MAAPSSAAKTVLAAGGVMTAITLAQAARNPGGFVQGGVYKRVWAIGVLTLALGVAADFAAPLIVPFAVAVVVGFTLRNPGGFGGVFGEGGAKQQAAGNTGIGGSGGASAGGSGSGSSVSGSGGTGIGGSGNVHSGGHG